jgi:hypothetical protein
MICEIKRINTKTVSMYKLMRSKVEAAFVESSHAAIPPNCRLVLGRDAFTK